MIQVGDYVSYKDRIFGHVTEITPHSDVWIIVTEDTAGRHSVGSACFANIEASKNAAKAAADYYSQILEAQEGLEKSR